MATFDQLSIIARDAGFQYRVQYAMSVAALAVYNEAANTTGHAARAKYATQVLNGSFNLQAAAWGVLQNPAVVAEANTVAAPDFGIPDGDIQFQVNSMWNALAGV